MPTPPGTAAATAVFGRCVTDELDMVLSSFDGSCSPTSVAARDSRPTEREPTGRMFPVDPGQTPGYRAPQDERVTTTGAAAMGLFALVIAEIAGGRRRLGGHRHERHGRRRQFHRAERDHRPVLRPLRRADRGLPPGQPAGLAAAGRGRLPDGHGGGHAVAVPGPRDRGARARLGHGVLGGVAVVGRAVHPAGAAVVPRRSAAAPDRPGRRGERRAAGAGLQLRPRPPRHGRRAGSRPSAGHVVPCAGAARRRRRRLPGRAERDLPGARWSCSCCASGAAPNRCAGSCCGCCWPRRRPSRSSRSPGSPDRSRTTASRSSSSPWSRWFR